MEEEFFKGLYLNTKLQVMNIGVQGNVHVSDAYLYAWDTDVFPITSSAKWHAPFERFFSVREKEMDELSKFLDDCWLQKKVPTFYQVEDRYIRFKKVDADWDRWKLITACRYMFLAGMFDKSFWDTILTPMQHPAEASYLNRPYDRDKDLSLD